MVDSDGKALFIGQPQLVEKDLGLGPGIVKDQGRLVALDLLQNGRNGVLAATAGPWRHGIGFQHGDIGIGPRVCLQDLAGVRVPGQKTCNRGRVLDRCRQAHAAQVRAERRKPRQGEHQLIATL